MAGRKRFLFIDYLMFAWAQAKTPEVKLYVIGGIQIFQKEESISCINLWEEDLNFLGLDLWAGARVLDSFVEKLSHVAANIDWVRVFRLIREIKRTKIIDSCIDETRLRIDLDYLWL